MKTIKKSILAALGIPALAFGVVMAEELRPKAQVQEDRRDVRVQNQQDRVEFREDRRGTIEDTRGQIKDNRQEFKTDAKEMRENGVPDDIKAARQEMRLKNQGLRQATREQITEKRVEMKTGIRERIAQFKEGRKVILDKAKQDRVKAHIGKAVERLNGAVARMETFNKRLEDVIAKREADGLDASEAKSKLDDARDSLAAAKVAIEAAEEAVNESVSAAEGVSSDALKNALREAVAAIKEAHAAYVEVIRSLPKPEESEDEEEDESEEEESSESTEE